MGKALLVNNPSFSSEQEEAIPTWQPFLALLRAFLRVQEEVIHLLELGQQPDTEDRNYFIIRFGTNAQ